MPRSSRWLKEIRYGQRDLLGKFTPGKARGKQRATLMRAGDYLYEIVGETRPMRVGLVCSTDMLTVGIIDLHPGQECEFISHPGDKVIYCLEGRANVYLPDETPNWWELSQGDSAFIPGGARHAFFNTSDAMAKVIFGVAPEYRVKSTEAWGGTSMRMKIEDAMRFIGTMDRRRFLAGIGGACRRGGAAGRPGARRHDGELGRLAGL